MASGHPPTALAAYAVPGTVNADLQAEYERLRAMLMALDAEPVKNFPAIDALIDQLEQLQLAIKGEHGIKGNNPNE